jgi:hypothetical protein
MANSKKPLVPNTFISISILRDKKNAGGMIVRNSLVKNCVAVGTLLFLIAVPSFDDSNSSPSPKSMHTQMRNLTTNHGYIYKYCIFEGAEGVTDSVLSRIL